MTDSESVADRSGRGECIGVAMSCCAIRNEKEKRKGRSDAFTTMTSFPAIFFDDELSSPEISPPMSPAPERMDDVSLSASPTPLRKQHERASLLSAAGPSAASAAEAPTLLRPPVVKLPFFSAFRAFSPSPPTPESAKLADQPFLYVGTFFFIIATMLGPTILALPATVFRSGPMPFCVATSTAWLVQSIVALYVIELLQRCRSIVERQKAGPRVTDLVAMGRLFLGKFWQRLFYGIVFMFL